jgi:hypothetical protein
MSCLENASGVYNPNPTREWTRFDTTCSENVSTSVADLNMRRKAEVLKYKQLGNSITQKQRWVSMAKGTWNKKSAWASQSQTITIPNTQGLQQSGNTLSCESTKVNCAYSTSSDVPGKPTILCLNESVPLVMYRKKYRYKAGGNKWPYNKGAIKYTF